MLTAGLGACKCGEEKQQWASVWWEEEAGEFLHRGPTGSHNSRRDATYGSCFGPWGMIKTVYTLKGEGRKQQRILCPGTGHPGDVLNC